MYQIKNLSGNLSIKKKNVFDLFSLEGKAAVCTGAARGIGQMTAVGLAGAGASVALLDIADTEQTREMIVNNGGKAISVYCDLAELEAEGEHILSKIYNEFGSIDILVNCGGITYRSEAIDYPLSKFDRTLDINLRAVFILSKLAAGYMKDSGGGKIINMASALSFQGGRLVCAYAASKGGVAQLTKAFANEWAKYNINVNALAPGYINTALNAAIVNDPVRSKNVMERLPAGRWGEPSDFIGTTIFLCSPASDYITGHVLCVDGGYQSR